MQRVAVVGCGGAGKSTFARELGRRTGLPVIHLDEHFWRPGWVETPRDEWVTVQTALAETERWIMDGNYGGTLDVRLVRADTVIVLDPPRLHCLRHAVGREVCNWRKPVQAAGCPERLDPTFLRWIWNYHRDSRPRLDAALARHCDHLEVIELTGRRSIASFLAHIPAEDGEASRGQ